MPFQGSGDGSGNSNGVPNNDSPDSDNLSHIAIQNGKHNGFLTNLSSSWMAEGVFDLDVENPLNFNLSDSGNFGQDNVSLNIQGSNQPTLSKQLVASFAAKDFYLGEYGLRPNPTNLSSFDDPLPSYIKTLADQDLIPSLSFGYIAGVKYRLFESPMAFRNLVLGGYDEGRLTPNNLTFPFAEVNSRSLTVRLKSIIISNAL